MQRNRHFQPKSTHISIPYCEEILKRIATTIILVLLLGNWGWGLDLDKEKQEKITQLQKALEKPETAGFAAKDLLDMNNAQAFAVLRQSFLSATPQIQIQIIRAFKFKRDPRCLSLLMKHFVDPSTNQEVVKEIGRALGEFEKHREVLEFLSTIVVKKKPAYPDQKREAALEAFQSMKPVVVIPYYIGILKRCRGTRDPMAAKVLTRLSKLTGSNFNSAREWEQWWIKNKDKSRVEWLQSINTKLRSKLKRFQHQSFTWWKKYLDAIQSSDANLYVRELVKVLQTNGHPEMTQHALRELQTHSLNQDQKKNVIEAILTLLQQEQNSSALRQSAVGALGKISAGADKALYEKSCAALLKIFNSPEDPKLRTLACSALASLKCLPARKSFLKSLYDEKESTVIVQEVLRNIGEFSETKDNAILKSILHRVEITYKDSDSNHSEMLALAIEKMGQLTYHHPKVLKKSSYLLQLLLRHKSMKIRYFAGNSLGKIGNPDAVAPLLKTFQESDNGVRLAVVAALKAISLRHPLSEKLRREIISIFVVYYKNSRLSLSLQNAMTNFIGKSFPLVHFSLVKIADQWKSLPAQQVQKYAQWAIQIGSQMLPPQNKVKGDEGQKQYRTCQIILVRSYLYNHQGEPARNLLGKIKADSPLHNLYLARALTLEGRHSEGMAELNRGLSQITTEERGRRYVDQLWKLLDLTSSKSPAHALVLIERLSKISWLTSREKRNLQQRKNKLQAPEKNGKSGK